VTGTARVKFQNTLLAALTETMYAFQDRMSRNRGQRKWICAKNVWVDEQKDPASAKCGMRQF